jgi:hypothetical protein
MLESQIYQTSNATKKKLVSLQYYPKLEFGNEFADKLKIFVSPPPSVHEGSVKLVKVSFDKVLLWPRNKIFSLQCEVLRSLPHRQGAMVLIKGKVR